MNKECLFIVCSLFISGVLFAQTPGEQKEIIRNYDLEKLNQLQKQFEAEYKTKKKEAVEYALENDIDIIIEKEDGGIKVLQEVLDDGTLIYYETRNAGSAQTSSTNELYSGGSLGLDLDGTGITAGVWDGGQVRSTHQELTGRVTFGEQFAGLSNHGTHVTGTVGASGINPNAKGMAPNADLLVYDFTDGLDLSEMTQEAANGLLLSNHSYGIPASSLGQSGLGAYIQQAANLDNLLYNAPFYSVQFAAGNDRNTNVNSGDNGFDLLTGTSLAKNAIIVANVSEVSNYTGPNSVNMSVSSSWGPTDDGRIKPDISAKGVNVFSTSAQFDTAYANLSGTSMASPGVTGSLALIQELNNELNSSYLRAATLKAIMINSAREAGNAPGPDYRFGWGLMNTEGMARTIMNNGFISLIEENVLQNNASYTKSVQAVGSNTPLKVTIAWQDLPGPIQSSNNEDDLTSRLVNDLDVRVTDSNGNVSQPWKLNNFVPSLPAQTGDNNTDNVEQIVVDNAVGDFTIEVTHKGNLQDAPQNYSIAVTGIAQSQFTFTSNEFQKEVCNNEDANYDIQFSSLETYNGPTNFSTSGLPGAITTNFSPNNFNADGDVTLTLSNLNNVSAGDYNFTVSASGQGETQDRDFTLTVLDASTLGNVSLNSPSGGQQDVSIAPILNWQALSGANNYTVDVSSDSNFNSVFLSQITSDTFLSVPELDPNTQYYWRVSAANDCSSGNFTSAGFTTEQLNCLPVSSSNDTPVTIPSNSESTQTATIDYPANNNELVHDLNVSVQITHTWVSDITLELQSPEGTNVLLLEEECGQNLDDIDVTFTDNGIALSCNNNPPAISGTISPIDPLSAFNGEDPDGVWTLIVSDSYPEDGGTIDDFSIEICDGTATFSNDDFTANQQAFEIYPNPAQDQITIEFSDTSLPASNINIYDLNGRIVKSYKFDEQQSSNLNLNISDISTGVYLVKTESSKGSSVEKLIIK